MTNMIYINVHIPYDHPPTGTAKVYINSNIFHCALWCHFAATYNLTKLVVLGPILG